MPTISPTRRNTVIAVALVTLGSIAWFQARGVDHHNATLRRQVQHDQLARQRKKEELAHLEKVLHGTTAGAPVKLQSAAPRLISHIEAIAPPHGIRVSSLQIAGRGNRTENPISRYIKGYRMPGLRKVGVTVHGHWQTLAGLTAWLHGLNYQSMTLTHVHIGNHRYAATVNILG